ncbi:flavoprotein domain-containing protein [Haematococcus lacustris]|uniref:phosphopantothenoylcysteine decarboxylase n=1 Tax=Haematococcus lacustris TaxID=44745 RepID=A0A6A0AEK4_HAELA|nr:flavoprotein domain-containing protein [Haematococcus lacustris]
MFTAECIPGSTWRVLIKRRFYNRDESAALNIRRITAGPGRPRELSSWPDRAPMPNPGTAGLQDWVEVRDKGDVRCLAESEVRVEVVRLKDDKDEMDQWHAVGDPVLHIELRRQDRQQQWQQWGSAAGGQRDIANPGPWETAEWADVLVLAPLSANSLAKAALGLCDNLVTCVLRAWDWQAAPVLGPATS